MSGPNPLFLREDELDRGLDLLLLAGRQLIAEARPLLEEAGLDDVDHGLLFCIQRRPGITLGELCQAMGLTKQTLSRHLGRLRQASLLDFGGGVDDRRKRPLVVTAGAIELLERVNGVQKRRLRLAFKKAGGPSAVEGFQRVIDALVLEPGARRAVSRVRVP